MKTLFALTIGFFAVTFLTDSSFAGPEPLESKTVAPRMVEPLCDWTGFYVGVHVGFGSGDSIWKDVDFGGNSQLFAGHQSHEGVFGGGQLGYNFQFGHFVIGAEGDFAYSDVGGEKRNVDQFLDASTINTDNDWTGTAAARLGYAFADNRVLAYVKGGAAFSHWNYHEVAFSSGDNGGFGSLNTFATDDTRINPMVGVGLEFAISCHWSAKLEARYVFLGKEDIFGTLFESTQPAEPPEPDETYQVDLRQVSAQVGLNYKFGGGHTGPSVTMAGVEQIESKNVVPIPEACNWTGFYVGVHVGYGFGDSVWRDFDGINNELPAGHQSQEGVFGGGQLGYNFQFGHFVIGAEGDFAYSDIGGDKRSDPFVGADIDTINTDNDWTGTAAARLGYAFADNRVLAYVKGGAAFSHWDYRLVHNSPTDSGVGTLNTFNTDDTRTTPMVGAGLEFAINCRWSARLEARYVFHGKEDIFGTLFESLDPPEPNETYRVELRQVSAQVGLNYKLW